MQMIAKKNKLLTIPAAFIICAEYVKTIFSCFVYLSAPCLAKVTGRQADNSDNIVVSQVNGGHLKRN